MNIIYTMATRGWAVYESELKGEKNEKN